jgi:hypothetical protein
VETKRATIDGQEYEITQLGALEGRKIWLRLVGALAAAIKELAAHETLDERAVASAAASVVSNLDEATFELMCKAFAKRCRVVNGAAAPLLDDVNFDLHFAGQYIRMTKWFAECVMYNFAGPLADSSTGNLVANFKAMAAALRSKSRPGSTGSPGVSSAPSA